MITVLYKKGLILVIIILFFGMGIISTNAGVVKNSIKQTDTQIENEEYPNFVGTIYVNWTNLYYEPMKNFRPTITIVPVPIEDRHYNFTVNEEKVRINFSAKVVVEQTKFLTLPRFTFAGFGFGADNNAWAIGSLKLPVIAWATSHINPKTYYMHLEDGLERDTQGKENRTVFIHLEGYGFPFGFLLPPGIIWTEFDVTTHFIYPPKM